MQEEQKKLRLPYTKSSGPYANVECKAKASSCKFAKRSGANLARCLSYHTYYTALVITTIRTFDVLKSIGLPANRCIAIINEK